MVAPPTPGAPTVRPQSSPVNPRLRRRRRILGAIPATLASWAVLSGLPLGAPAPATAGNLHAQTISLTGPNAKPTAPSGARARALRPAPTAAAEGWSATVEVDPGTVAAGISWTGAPNGAVEVRGWDGDDWSDWTEIEGEPGEEPDTGPAVSGNLAWFGGDGVRRIEARVELGNLQNLKIQAMQYDTPSAGGMLQTAVAGADARPAIRPRSDWTSKGWATSNSDCASGPRTAPGGVKFAVVHHTVNSNTYSQADVPAMLASIYRFHTSTPAQGGRGWCDIAYNFVIDRFGQAWEARSGGAANAIVGGHAAGFNTNSVGVSFLGQYQSGASPTAVQPTAAALQAAGRVIGWKLGMNGLDPNSTVSVTSSSGGSSAKYPSGRSVSLPRVSGHQNVGYTDCPGSHLFTQLSTIRATAATVASQTTPTIPSNTTTTTRPGSGQWGPFTSSGALVDQSYQDLLKRSPTASERSSAVAALDGGRSPGAFLAGLATSTEADAKVNSVIRLYRAYFLRNPDHGGLKYWEGKRISGWGVGQISDQFVGTPEFRNRYGSLTNASFVNLVYRNVIGRPGEPSGVSYWQTTLAKGMSRGQMMASFSESSEYKRTTLAGVQVVALYDGLIQGTILEGTYTYLEPRLRTSITNTAGVAQYFFDKPEYAARF